MQCLFCVYAVVEYVTNENATAVEATAAIVDLYVVRCGGFRRTEWDEIL